MDTDIKASEVEPIDTSEAEPIDASEAEPILSSEVEPIVTSEVESTVASEMEPILVSDQEKPNLPVEEKTHLSAEEDKSSASDVEKKATEEETQPSTGERKSEGDDGTALIQLDEHQRHELEDILSSSHASAFKRDDSFVGELNDDGTPKTKILISPLKNQPSASASATSAASASGDNVKEQQEPAIALESTPTTDPSKTKSSEKAKRLVSMWFYSPLNWKNFNFSLECLVSAGTRLTGDWGRRFLFAACKHVKLCLILLFA